MQRLGGQLDASVGEHVGGGDALAYAHGLLAGEEAADQRGGVRLYLGKRPLRDDPPAVSARARPHLHEPVCGGQDARVVVHHDHRVAVGEQIAHHLDEPVDVGGVQTDGRLVQHVQHAGGSVAHGAGQLHALALSGGQRGARAIEREIAQPQIDEAARRVLERLDDVVRHRAHLGRETIGHGVRPGDQLVEGLRGRLGQVDARNLREARLRGEARAVALGADALLEEAGHAPQTLFVLHLRQRVLHGVDGVVVGEVQLGEGVGLLRLVQDVLLLGWAGKHDVALGGRQLVEGHVGAHAHLARDLLHEVPHERAPGRDGAFVDGEPLVGHQRVQVHGAHDARAVALGAGAAAVEGQVLRAGAEELHAADGARDRALGGDVQRGRHAVAVRAHVAAGAREQQAQAVQQLGGRAEGAAHAGHAGPLVQGERGGHVQHLVHGGAARLRQAAARVGGERFKVAPRPLGVQHAQGERRLARPRYARDADEPVQRDAGVDVFQVVHARSAHLDAVGAVQVAACGGRRRALLVHGAPLGVRRVSSPFSALRFIEAYGSTSAVGSRAADAEACTGWRRFAAGSLRLR